MEVDLIELWNQLKTCMEKDRSALLERWNQVRFEKLSEFRREFDSLDLAKMIEQVQWEESIQTKGYAIDRGLLPLYEDGLTAVYRARKNFDSNLMFCKVYQIQQQKQTTQADFGRFLASLSLFKNVNLVSFEKLFEVTKTKKFYLMMPYPFSGNVSGQFVHFIPSVKHNCLFISHFVFRLSG